jgi:hypothetical protein
MANPRGIVHSDLRGRVQANFYPMRCTIQQMTEAQNSYGEISSSWSNLAGHVDLPCRVAAELRGSAERRTQDQVYAVHGWTIALNGYYPSIIPKMRALVAGVAYDIELVQHDGNGIMTRLVTRIVE